MWFIEKCESDLRVLRGGEIGGRVGSVDVLKLAVMRVHCLVPNGVGRIDQ